MSDPPDWLSTTQAAELLGITGGEVSQRIREGTLRAVRAGNGGLGEGVRYRLLRLYVEAIAERDGTLPALPPTATTNRNIKR